VKGTCGRLIDASPAANVTLSAGIVSHGDHPAVVLKSHCVKTTCRNHGRAFGPEVSRYGAVAAYHDPIYSSVGVVSPAFDTSPLDETVTFVSFGY